MTLNKKIHDEQIPIALLKVTCLCWLIMKCIGWRIWTVERLLPAAPVFNMLYRVPPVVHLILFTVSIFCIGSLLFRQSKPLFLLLIITELLSCLLDQNRWQPWAFQYIFIILIFIINYHRQKLIVRCFILILASTYFYSGMHKLNAGFLQLTWSQTILHFFLKIPFSFISNKSVYYFGYFIGIYELSGGVGLLFAKSQKIAAKALILMHLFVLMMLSPLGLNFNTIVWPWNIAMILYLYLIFLRGKSSLFVFEPIFFGWNNLVLLCWGILPSLSFIGYWDAYLSSGMYSGRSPAMIICISDTLKSRPLKPYYENTTSKNCSIQTAINLQHWSIKETNISPNPELRVYKIIAAKLSEQYPNAGLSFYYSINGKKVTSP